MIEITTLGDLKININGEEVSERHVRTTKLWKLLSLLLLNRNKPLRSKVICESVWQEDELGMSEKALQNLIYRLRKLLTYEGAPEFIQFKGNGYLLRNDEKLSVDIHLFEDYFEATKKSGISRDKRVELLKKATDIYNGEYIFDDDDVRAANAATRYESIFIKVGNELAAHYLETEDHDELAKLCDKGISLHPFEGSFYEHLVISLRTKGWISQALAVCENYFDIHDRQLDAPASDLLNKMYKQMIRVKRSTISLQHGVGRVLKELKGSEPTDSALFCSFEVLKDIFRYEERRALRNGSKVYIILISISDNRDDVPEEKVLSEIKRCLRKCCIAVLGEEDVVAEYSQTQHIVMKTGTNAEEIRSIISHIEKQFHENNRNRGVKIFCEFEQILKLEKM